MKLLLTFGLLSSTVAFAPGSAIRFPVVRSAQSSVLSMSESLSSSTDNHASSTDSRRQFLSQSASLLVGGILATGPLALPMPANAAADTTKSAKIVVLGGTGFVGSQVVSTLQGMGVEVIATSTSGRDGTVALDFTKQNGESIQKDVQKLATGASAVISCIGAIGTSDDTAVNSGTGYAAVGAKAAGVDRFVYISVAPEVKDFAKNIDFLKGYLAGKSFSQHSIFSQFSPTQYTLIEPTFIYGGDEFKVSPPRVAGFYGSFVEGVLSSDPLRALTKVAPEGIIKIGLEPPVSVDAVAKAAIAGALGKSDIGELDTYDKIKQAAGLL